MSDDSPDLVLNLCIFMGLVLGGILSVAAGALWVLTYDVSNEALAWFFLYFWLYSPLLT